MIVQDAIDRFDTEILDYLDRDAEIPTVAQAACQGDVSILRVTSPAAKTPVPKSGVPVVRGESGGNTHAIHGEGPVFWDSMADGSNPTALGTLTVPGASTAVMAHPEHGFLLIAPGTYRIGRQREQADEVELVAD